MGETLVREYLGLINLSLNPDYSIEKHLLENGSWEDHVAQVLKFFVSEGTVCVDVGANTGIHALTLAALAGAKGKVIAFEPSPVYSSRIKRNISLNPGLAGQIEVRCRGISDKPGTLNLYESGDGAGNAYMSESYDPSLWNRFGPEVFTECPVSILDQEFPDTTVDLIKIDVEGMEARVIQGATRLIERDRPVLVYETLIRDFGIPRTKAMDDLVRAHGYHVFYAHKHFGKLVSGFFPNYPEDVVAVHPRRLLAAAPIMHNAIRYLLSGTECTNCFGTELYLTIISLDENLYAICLSQMTDNTTEMQLVSRDDSGALSFSQSVGGKTFTVSISVLTKAGELINGDPGLSVESADEGVRQLSVSRVGGMLYPVLRQAIPM